MLGRGSKTIEGNKMLTVDIEALLAQQRRPSDLNLDDCDTVMSEHRAGDAFLDGADDEDREGYHEPDEDPEQRFRKQPRLTRTTITFEK
jgi:hypothetical protein